MPVGKNSTQTFDQERNNNPKLFGVVKGLL